MTTGTLPQRNVAPWADFSTMPAHQLQTIWLRAGLELDLANWSADRLDSPGREEWTWWLLVLSATAATHHDRWCEIE